MANVLQIKRNTYGSGGAPASLSNAELAYDGQNDILYIGKQTDDTPVTITPTVLVQTASTSAKGVARFNDLDFDVSASGEVTLETTSTAAELNLVDGASAGTVVNSKAAIYGSSGELNMTTLQIGGTSVTSSAAELNTLDGVTAGTVSASKAVVVDSNKDLTGMRNLTITGDLTVGGDTTTLNTATLDVEDLNITVASGATTSLAADGAGLTVAGANATMIYDHTGTQWEFNKPIEAQEGFNDTTFDCGTYAN